MENHDVLAASDGCYREAVRLVGNCFTGFLNYFDMGKMGSGAGNLKFFLRRHYIWLIVVFC